MPMPMKPASEIGVSTTRLSPHFVPESLGHLVGSVVLGDFLTHDDDVFVAGEFFVHGFTEGFTIGKSAHDKMGDWGKSSGEGV